MVTGQASNVLQMMRKSYKESIVVMLREKPDLSLREIVGIVSTRTGLSHKRIFAYIDELIYDKRIPESIRDAD